MPLNRTLPPVVLRATFTPNMALLKVRFCPVELMDALMSVEPLPLKSVTGVLKVTGAVKAMLPVPPLLSMLTWLKPVIVAISALVRLRAVASVPPRTMLRLMVLGVRVRVFVPEIALARVMLSAISDTGLLPALSPLFNWISAVPALRVEGAVSVSNVSKMRLLFVAETLPLRLAF